MWADVLAGGHRLRVIHATFLTGSGTYHRERVPRNLYYRYRSHKLGERVTVEVICMLNVMRFGSFANFQFAQSAFPELEVTLTVGDSRRGLGSVQ